MTADQCTLCPRACGAQRGPFAGRGRCGMGTLPVVARAAPHFGEEPCLTGTRGSGAVFFVGCCLGCVFCQNRQISRGGALAPSAPDGRGKELAKEGGCPPRFAPLSAEALGRVFAALRGLGVHNINLVTASHFAPAVAETLRRYPPGVPVVYNCSGYESVETLRLLEGLVDVYLPDFKFADSGLAAQLAGAPDYPDVALAAIREMRRQTGSAAFGENGLLLRGTLVRHLVLPGLTGASMKALAMLRDALPRDVPLSLMGQYTPWGPARESAGLNRPLTSREYGRVRAQMRALGFPGYVQPPSASGAGMIPAFDGTGVSR